MLVRLVILVILVLPIILKEVAEKMLLISL